MKILLAIPSKNRADILQKFALRWASLVQCVDVVVFLEPQDINKYRLITDFKFNIQTLPENNRGLGFAKDCIQGYARGNGYDLVFKVDDDTAGFSNYRSKSKTPEESAAIVNSFLSKFIAQFEKYPNLKAISFPYDFQMFSKFEFEPAKKCQSSYLVRTEYLCSPYEFSVFEDFAIGLNILVKGGKLLKYGMSGQQVGVPVGKGKGGLQDFDRAELAKKDADMLRKLYPPISFKKVNKPWGIEPDMRSIKL